MQGQDDELQRVIELSRQTANAEKAGHFERPPVVVGDEDPEL